MGEMVGVRGIVKRYALVGIATSESPFPTVRAQVEVVVRRWGGASWRLTPPLEGHDKAGNAPSLVSKCEHFPEKMSLGKQPHSILLIQCSLCILHKMGVSLPSLPETY